jgi:hypothetical protein
MAEMGGGGWRRGTGWRNDPNNVCTCEYMNNNNKRNREKIRYGRELRLKKDRKP